MWGRTVRALRGLFDVPAGLWPVPYGDHYHDNAPLQNLLRDGHTCVRGPVFDGFRLRTTTTTTQRTLPARHGAAAHRLHMSVPDDHHHHFLLSAGDGRLLRRGGLPRGRHTQL